MPDPLPFDRPRPGRRRGGPPAQVERLEPRVVPSRTNTLLIDYTIPKNTLELSNGRYVAEASFLSLFTETSFAGLDYRFNWLDFNGDRKQDKKDFALAQSAIHRRVRAYFKPVSKWLNIVSTGGADHLVGRDSGQFALDIYRRLDNAQGAVLYVAGSNFFRRQPKVRGVSFQAPVGTNIEGYGFVFARNIAGDVERQVLGRAARRRLFVELIAYNIVHEYGHFLGLGHVRGNPAKRPDGRPDTNVMNYRLQRTPHKATIPNYLYRNHIELRSSAKRYCGAQNPLVTLRSSLTVEAVYRPANRWKYNPNAKATPHPCGK